MLAVNCNVPAEEEVQQDPTPANVPGAPAAVVPANVAPAPVDPAPIAPADVAPADVAPAAVTPADQGDVGEGGKVEMILVKAQVVMWPLLLLRLVLQQATKTLRELTEKFCNARQKWQLWIPRY